MSKSIILRYFNDTNVNVDSEINVTTSNTVISESDKRIYDMCVTRLTVPTTSISKLYFTDRSKHYTALKMYNANDDEHTVYTKTLPSLESHNISYNTNEQILEMLNRSLSNCYRQYLEGYTTVDTNCYPNRVAQSSKNLTNAAASNSQTITTSYGHFACCKLNVTALTVNSGDLTKLVRLYIQAPSNEKLYVFVGTLGDLVNAVSNTGGNLVFSEDAYNDVGTWYSPSSSNNDVKIYGSLETFRPAGSAITTSGTWKVGIDSNGTWDVDISYTLHVMFSDGSTIPSIQPFLVKSGGKIGLNYQTIYYTLNNMVGFSPYFSSALRFSSLGTVYDSTNVVYWEKFEENLMTTWNEIINMTPEDDNLYRLSNIATVSIFSNTFGGTNEFVLSTPFTSVSSTMLVSDFIINKDTEYGNNLILSIDAEPWRRISLENLSSDFHSMQVRVMFNYLNGLTRTLILCPNEFMSMRLSFLKKKY